MNWFISSKLSLACVSRTYSNCSESSDRLFPYCDWSRTTYNKQSFEVAVQNGSKFCSGFHFLVSIWNYRKSKHSRIINGSINNWQLIFVKICIRSTSYAIFDFLHEFSAGYCFRILKIIILLTQNKKFWIRKLFFQKQNAKMKSTRNKGKTSATESKQILTDSCAIKKSQYDHISYEIALSLKSMDNERR